MLNRKLNVNPLVWQIIITSIFFMNYSSCDSGQADNSRPEKPVLKSDAVNQSEKPTIKSEVVKSAPPKKNIRTEYTLIDTKRFDFKNYKRLVAHIDVEDDFSEEEIRTALKNTLKAVNNDDFDAIRVLAFRKSNPKKSGSLYAVGNLIYAPNGKWEDANLQSNFQTKMEINVDNKVGELQKNEIKGKAQIVSKESKRVEVYRTADDWSDENVIKKLRVGTNVKVVEKKEEQISSTYKLCHYKIKIKGKVGWVNCKNIAPCEK